MKARIAPEVAFIFGTDDPAVVFNAAFRKFTSPMRKLLQRAVGRLPSAVYVVDDDKDKKKAHQIDLKPSATAGPQELALQFAIVATKMPRGGDLLIDEARRMSLNQGPGPKAKKRKKKKRGLEGDLTEAHSLDARSALTNSLDDDGYDDGDDFDSLDAEKEFLSEEIWRAFGQPVAGGFVSEFMRGLDADEHGHDHTARSIEPISTVAVLAIIVPALVAVALFVLPMVIDAGGKFIKAVTSGVDPGTAIQDVLSGKDSVAEKEAADAAARAKKDAEGKQTPLIIGGVVAVVVVIATVLYIRHKRATA